MYGMEDVADQMRVFIDREVDLANRAAAGKSPKKRGRVYHNMLMTGPPGTGKSTVAKVVAESFGELGITKKGKDPVMVNAADWVGEYVGEAEARATKAMADAKDGVLFVDEAHQLADSEFGRRALRALMAPTADPTNKTVVIMAGYPEQMRALEDIDPGFKSRFPLELKFNAYSGEALANIMADKIEEEENLGFTGADAERALRMAAQVIAENPNNGNVRDAEHMLTLANDARIARVKAAGNKMPLKKRYLFTPGDFETAAQQYARR